MPEPDFSDGLRALADILDAHPKQKRDHNTYRHHLFMFDWQHVVSTVRTFGGEWYRVDSDLYDGWERDLGNGVSVYVYIRKAAAAVI